MYSCKYTYQDTGMLWWKKRVLGYKVFRIKYEEIWNDNYLDLDSQLRQVEVLVKWIPDSETAKEEAASLLESLNRGFSGDN